MQVHKMIMLGALWSVVVLPVPGPIAAQPTTIVPATATAPKPVEVVKKDGETEIKLNFQDAPLQTVLEYLSEAAGLTVVSDQPLAGSRITVISRQPITLDQAVSLINSALKESGSTTVLIGKTLKVVALTNAKKENLPVLTGRDPEAIVPSDDVVSYVIPVGHVTAAALKQNLEALRPEYASIEANEDGNALIITDTLANIKRLMQIVVALDTHMATVAEIRVFRLVSADATSAATLINNIFQQQAQSGRSSQRGRGGPGGPFEMMMEMRNRREGDNRSQQGATSINVQVVAAADERTNSVVVRGPAEALDLVADMIKALDDTSARVADVRVFQLRYADALNAADVINQLFGTQQSSSRSSRGGRGDFGPTMFRGPFGGGPGGAQQGNAGGSTLQVSAAADSRTNTVVVTGPETILNIVEDVIKKLDMPLADMADVKVFHLEYADAQDTAELINEVFGQSRTSSSSRSSRSGSQQNQRVMFMRGPFGGGMAQQTGDTGGASSVDVIASADSRTNSVVVSGPATTLEVIAQIIKQLDENPEQERRIFVYALKNAYATNLMTILNNLFTEMQALNQRTTGRTGTQFQGGQRGGAATPAAGPGGGGAASASSSSNSESLSEETYCQADPNTNSLLIMTSTKNYQKIKPIIEELDKPVAQVLIKVLFAELSHTNSVDLGTEFSMLNLNDNGGSTETIQVFGRPPTLLLPGGTGGPTGLSIRTIQGDLDLILHALQETGRLNVLSRPYVLTRNNQLARITVAEEVPIPTGSTTVAGQTQTTITYRDDIGIVLNVTPSINPDGIVNMIVVPQITTRTGETVPISETLEAETFITRSAETRVAVRDGQTIVIGGLIEDQETDTVKKIPLLGDIPIAGALFRRTITDKRKTELLIFLTPRVAQEPAALTPISEAEKARSNLGDDSSAGELFRKHMDAMQDTGTPQPQAP
jgi:general secretion pathway protein D